MNRIYLAAITDKSRSNAAAIAVTDNKTFTWNGIYSPGYDKYRNAKEKALYAESYALEQIKLLLAKEKYKATDFEVYFYSLQTQYKKDVPRPDILRQAIVNAMNV